MSNEPFRTNANTTNDTLAGHRDIHMKMWPQTIEKMETLKRTLHTTNKTDAVRAAIDIALFVTRAITEGDEVVIEKRNGEKSKLIVSGLYKGE